MQAFAHHGPVVPVQGVNNAGVTIDIPAMQAGTVEQLAGVFEQPGGRGQAALLARSFQVQQQARPFKGVTRGFTEGAEWIARMVPVVLRQRLPPGIEVFDGQVGGLRGVLVDHPLADAQGALQPQVLVEHVGQGEKGFGAVHIAVGPAIRFAVAPVTSEGLQQGTFVFAPEPCFQHRYRFIQ